MYSWLSNAGAAAECLDQQIGSGGAVRYTGWIVVLMLLVGSSSASDLARERRIALELEDAILIGSPLRLSANGSEFSPFMPSRQRRSCWAGLFCCTVRGQSQLA